MNPSNNNPFSGGNKPSGFDIPFDSPWLTPQPNLKDLLLKPNPPPFDDRQPWLTPQPDLTDLIKKIPKEY